MRLHGFRIEDWKLGIEQLSTAADSDYDLKAVAVGDPLMGMPAAGHDLAVSLERDTLSRKLEPRDQLGAVDRRLELPVLAVEGDRDHAATRIQRFLQAAKYLATSRFQRCMARLPGLDSAIGKLPFYH
jgi:hypothetical protein